MVSRYNEIMQSARELRQKYLTFFEKKGALRLPSASLVAEDPTLMFTVAGMVPFKAYFENSATPPRNSLTTAQKCLRTKDIDDIGDTSHCTFFEMLGNFSFGDYFKTEAVAWAWEFLKDEMGLDPLTQLRVTVYHDDNETYHLWRGCGMPNERITRLGQKTNYWPANALEEKTQGPCGPCSEIFFDTRPELPFDTDWDGEGSRWLEIWNLVFTQFTGSGEGEAYQLIALPKNNIDTGMGLDRTVAAINNLSGPFETDLLRPLISVLEELSGKSYASSADNPNDIAFRRIADHARAAVFLLSDGVTPDRTGRGYVLRRLMRRAVVAGIRQLNFDTPFLHQIVPTVLEVMGEAYPDLVTRKSYILEQIKQEETLFRRTLQNGLARLDDALTGGGELSGEAAFDLYDTFGLPFEITREIAAERGTVVDEAGYETARAEAVKRSREAQGKVDVWGEANDALTDLLKSLPTTEFVGYRETTVDVQIVGLIAGSVPVQSAEAGQTVDVLLNVSPFYAESGGQVGDSGELRTAYSVFEVTDTKKQNGLFFHKGAVKSGTIAVGDVLKAHVDVMRRHDVCRNHTATHLLHKALRDRLGGHVQQRGSLVAPDKLRFDFAHTQALTDADLKAIEDEVNAAILASLPVVVEEKPITEARQMGAMMLFGEKYGDLVRVVSVGGPYSREFCGGTHVQNASQIGPFRLISEASASAGVRRIEAVTGRGANTHDTQNTDRLKAVAQILSVSPQSVPETVQKLQADLKAARTQIAQLSKAQTGNASERLAASAKAVRGVPVVIARADVADGAALSALLDEVFGRMPNGIVVLGGEVDGAKLVFAAKAAKTAVAQGVHMGNVVKAAAQAAGGNGGGRPDFAQAGGRDISKLGDALRAAEETLVSQLA